jgi:uncharacterized membrane protein
MTFVTFMDIPKTVSCIVVIIGLYLGHISTSGTKTQTIRLLDVFLIGPLMIYFGHNSRVVSIFSILLIFFGATTITYNLKNYIHALHESK